jgi:hypothetical protein
MKMNRLMIATCLAALLCCATGCCDKGKNRLDITLEGPWILFQDTQFDNNGEKIPVLIAIAPINATTDQLASNDYIHHHSPQLSTGDGFYLSKAYLNEAHIYCLAFNDRCAPKGSQALSRDPYYPSSRLLTLSQARGSGTWDWINASKKQAALILPMPDSYSNDGVWNVRFSSNGDEPHSIGLHLHYAHGPNTFVLQSCDDNQRPSVSACKKPVADALTNNGTLRIQMRAPDNEDVCDWHVRNAWEETVKILGPSFGDDHAHIEPAQKLNPDGTGVYGIVPCTKSDPHSHYPYDELANSPGALHVQPQQSEVQYSNQLLTDVFLHNFDASIQTIIEQAKLQTSPERTALEALKSETTSLNPRFPRISQMRLISGLVRDSSDLIDRLEGQFGNNRVLLDAIKDVKEKGKSIRDNPDTKNGADCRAPVVLVQ